MFGLGRRWGGVYRVDVANNGTASVILIKDIGKVAMEETLSNWQNEADAVNEANELYDEWRSRQIKRTIR